jgi:predicted RNase H-like nuclease (RuvC/YqgF family)
MTNYNNYLEYLHHVDNTTKQEIKVNEKALNNEIAKWKTLSDNLNKEKDELTKNLGQANTEIEKLKKDAKEKQAKMKVYLDNINKEKDDLLKKLEQALTQIHELERPQKSLGIKILFAIGWLFFVIISLPLVGVPLFIYKNVKTKKIKSLLVQKYEMVRRFSNGRAVVMSSDKKYGFVNKSGKEVIPLRYDDAQDFSDGQAKVKYQNKWLNIDKKGIIV